MKNDRHKSISMLLLVGMIVSILLTTPAMASETAFMGGNINATTHSPGTAPYSIDNTYTLNFSESTAWTIDFTNAHLIFLAHQFVTIEYKSCSPSNPRAKVTVELFIDDDHDGTYDPYDPNGEYLFTLTVGEKYSIALPYGGTVENYRLVFINQTSSVSSGTFAVKTE